MQSTGTQVPGPHRHHGVESARGGEMEETQMLAAVFQSAIESTAKVPIGALCTAVLHHSPYFLEQRSLSSQLSWSGSTCWARRWRWAAGFDASGATIRQYRGYIVLITVEIPKQPAMLVSHIQVLRALRRTNWKCRENYTFKPESCG